MRAAVVDLKKQLRQTMNTSASRANNQLFSLHQYTANTQYLILSQLARFGNQTDSFTAANGPIFLQSPFYAEEFENSKGNSCKTWELLRTQLPGKSSKDSPLPQNVTIQGNKITNQQQILKEFNYFFSKIGEKLACGLGANDEESFKKFLSSRVTPSIFLEPPRVNEIIVALNSLNFYESCGHDDIPLFFLCTVCCVLAPTLCYFVDNAFRLGILPRICNIAKIVPLFKTEKTEELTNHRPITNLTCFSKIFEELIHSRLNFFFKKNPFYTTRSMDFEMACQRLMLY